jgi:hypothetical protein
MTVTSPNYRPLTYHREEQPLSLLQDPLSQIGLLILLGLENLLALLL